MTHLNQIITILYSYLELIILNLLNINLFINHITYLYF